MEFLRRLVGQQRTAQDSCYSFIMEPRCCPRQETVAKLAEILDEEGVVNVRGTPASGKSVLASLLHAHYLAREKPTILLRGWRKAPRENGTDFLIREARVMGYTIARPFIENADLVIILDDGQTSYDDLFFWLSLVKSQSMNRFGARICIFTSYGSPRSGPVEKIGYTLAFLGPQQRVSITPSNVRFSPEISLFYTREEFNDVVTRFCRNPSLLRLDSSAHDYTFELTNGQPGAVDAVLRMLEKVYRGQLKQGEAVNKEDIFRTLDNKDTFEFLSQTRSFPSRAKITPQAAHILRKVLADGNIPQDLEDEGIRVCYEQGWLHSEPLDLDAADIVCVFPTCLHAKFAEHTLTDSTVPFPLDKFPSIRALTEATLKVFSRNNLRAPRLGSGATIRPIDATYQDEFYRSIHHVLGYAMGVSREWSADGKGRIDFRLNNEQWGFELLRDGDRLQEHCEKFTSCGSYSSWITNNQLRDWIILDCRTSSPKPYKARNTKLWRAVFTADFSSCEVLDQDNKVVVSRFVLMD